MSELVVNNGFGLDPENIARVYRGEPALVGEKEASDVLTPRVFEAASYAARGLSYNQISDAMGVTFHTTRTELNNAYSRLGVPSKYNLAAYFPIDPNDELLDGKRLGNLASRAVGLEILQSLSAGMHYGTIALERGITTSTIRTHMLKLRTTWPDIKSITQTLGLANGLRARYVQTIESATGTMEPEDIAQLTLPRLVKLEPGLLKRYAV